MIISVNISIKFYEKLSKFISLNLHRVFLSPRSFVNQDLTMDLIHTSYCFSSHFDKFQNGDHLLKFYLSESCKSMNNSQLCRCYHVRL